MSTPIFVPYDAKTGQHDFLEALLLTHLEIKSIKGYENFEWVSDTRQRSRNYFIAIDIAMCMGYF